MRFVVTDELGRLLRWLRILGFDVVLEKDRSNLDRRMAEDGRILLTRSARIGRSSGGKVMRIKSELVEEQLGQLLRIPGLSPDRKGLFTRCTLCNGALEAVGKETVADRVPAHVFATQEAFSRCADCGKIYWQGTHWDLVNKFLDRV